MPTHKTKLIHGAFDRMFFFGFNVLREDGSRVTNLYRKLHMITDAQMCDIVDCVDCRIRDGLR